MASISLGFSVKHPRSFLIWMILFWALLCLTTVWKNLVLLSPWRIQFDLAFWAHINSSLFRSSSKSFLRDLSNLTSSIVEMEFWICCNWSCFSLISLLAFPNTCLFQAKAIFLTLRSFFHNCSALDPWEWKSQACWAMSLHEGWVVHICSYLKGLLIKGVRYSKSRIIRPWSDRTIGKFLRE